MDSCSGTVGTTPFFETRVQGLNVVTKYILQSQFILAVPYHRTLTLSPHIASLCKLMSIIPSIQNYVGDSAKGPNFFEMKKWGSSLDLHAIIMTLSMKYWRGSQIWQYSGSKRQKNKHACGYLTERPGRCVTQILQTK